MNNFFTSNAFDHHMRIHISQYLKSLGRTVWLELKRHLKKQTKHIDQQQIYHNNFFYHGD